MRAPELGHGSALGLGAVAAAGQLQRLIDVRQDHLPGARQLVVDLALERRERILQALVGDIIVGERAGRVDAQGLEVAGRQLHRGDAAGRDLADERLGVGEGGVLAPETQALGIGQVGDLGGAGRRDVEHPGVGDLLL
jgi:hypothetical protein